MSKKARTKDNARQGGGMDEMEREQRARREKEEDREKPVGLREP